MLAKIFHIIKMLLTPRFGCTIKQFSNCDFSYKTIICTHILNSVK